MAMPEAKVGPSVVLNSGEMSQDPPKLFGQFGIFGLLPVQFKGRNLYGRFLWFAKIEIPEDRCEIVQGLASGSIMMFKDAITD